MGLTPSFSEWTKMRLRATSRPVSLQVDLWTSLRNRGESCLVSVSCLLNRESASVPKRSLSQLASNRVLMDFARSAEGTTVRIRLFRSRAEGARSALLKRTDRKRFYARTRHALPRFVLNS